MAILFRGSCPHCSALVLVKGPSSSSALDRIIDGPREIEKRTCSCHWSFFEEEEVLHGAEEPEEEEEVGKPPPRSPDLFDGIKSLWTKRRLEGMPSTWIMHRFLASEPDLAIIAKYFQREIRDEKMRVHAWMGILPKGRGAPRLKYVAPKKGKSEDDLTARMMLVEGLRREVAEAMISLVELEGRKEELFSHYGVNPPEEGEEDEPF